MTGPSPRVELLQASVDTEDISEFRVLVDSQFVKYITIDAGIYGVRDMCFGPSLVRLLPPLPSGPWIEAHISRDANSGAVSFSSVFDGELNGVSNVWHPNKVDYLALQDFEKLRSNVYEVSCPGYTSRVIAKFARFEWEIPQLEAETTAYQWISGQDIGPEFLAHLTEEGRVIGFLITRIVNCRHATPEDFSLCSSVLTKLHRLEIRHGDTNKHNFLIHDDQATMIDFDFASRPASHAELEEELHGLKDQLEEKSGRGGQIIESEPN